MDGPSVFPLAVPALAGGSPLYVTGEEAIRLSVLNSQAGVTCVLTGRFLPVQTRDNDSEPRVQVFRHDLIPATNRTVSTRTEALGEGWLLDWQVLITAGGSGTGQTYAIVTLVRGKSGAVQEVTLLGKGYVTANQRLGEPGAIFADMTDGAGFLRSIAGTTPGAGADISETVPTGARWELLAFHGLLTTAVAVANRIPRFVLDDGVNTFWNAPQGAAQTASLAEHYQAAQGFTGNFSDTLTTFFQALPFNLRLGAGFRIRTVTAAIQAADQWSAVQYLVREWLEVN